MLAQSSRRAVKSAAFLGVVLGTGMLFAQAPVAPPPAPVPAPAAPTTFWNFLGIPQGVNRIRDAHLNKSGFKPQAERQPHLRALTDPANFVSGNPAIKKAAEIKMEQDLCPQKIKAIRYLSTVACGCYPGVREALLAALDDCTEAVRYEAALALCRTAGNPCSACNKTSCCSPAVAKKLNDMAFGTDEQGCYKEPSARVRAAAANALRACEAVMPAAPGLQPIPVPEKAQPPIGPIPEGGAVQSPSAQNESPRQGARFATEAESRDIGVRLASLVAEMESEAVSESGPEPALIQSQPVQDEVEVQTSSGAQVYPVGLRPRGIRGQVCPPGYVPVAPSVIAPATPSAPTPAAPGEQAVAPAPGEGTAEFAAPSPSALAGTMGAATGPATSAPTMIGDFMGGGITYTGPLAADAATALGGASVDLASRRFKIVDSNSPIPQDRFFFNYNHYENPLVDLGGEIRNVDRYTFGLEKTFRDGLWSAEFRVPFAAGLDSTQSIQANGEYGDLTATEFGDIGVAMKRYLLRRERFEVAAGLGVIFPTADDFVITSADSANPGTVVFENEAVHLQPFVGALWRPNDRLFVIGFSQLDFDAGGSNVLSGIGDLVDAGDFHEQSLLFMDISLGYWIYQNPCARCLTGVAPMLELHYSTTMDDPDLVVLTDGLGTIQSYAGRRDILDLTAGFRFQMGPLSTLTVAGVAPLRTGRDRNFGAVPATDRNFDAEFVVQFNRRF